MKCVLINRNDETNVRQKEGDKTWSKSNLEVDSCFLKESLAIVESRVNTVMFGVKPQKCLEALKLHVCLCCAQEVPWVSKEDSHEFNYLKGN